MIAILNGKLIYKTSTEVVISCGGVGYAVFVSLNTYDKLPETGQEATLHTILVHNELSMQLFGFFDIIEKETFKLLVSVSGIGPKTALGILSSVPVESLQSYILTNNVAALQKFQGIGKKTAERIVLELKDKMLKLPLTSIPNITDTKNIVKQEALAALVTLGFSAPMAEKVIKLALDIDKDKDLSAEELIKKALKIANK